MLTRPIRPQVVAFDVIETLFSLEPMRPRLQALGLPPTALEQWFSATLRDAFALAATDTYSPFEALAADTLKELIAEKGRSAATGEIMGALAGMQELQVHPDVRAAFEQLRQAQVRVVALSNGSAKQTRTLLEKAGLLEMVEKIISTDEVKLFKPRREVYQYTASEMKVEPHQLALVAAHAWDVHGAKCAGLSTGWVERREKRLSSAMQGPDIGGKTLDEIVKGLLALPTNSESDA